MEHSVNKANEYLRNAKTDLKNKNSFFYDVPTGWMNDPNGCVYAFGYYHIFFQFSPYSVKPEYAHWGHTRTKDFIHFEDLGVAIAPDMEYDKDGCWSGSATFDGEKIIIMYTGFSFPFQQQCVAYSYDGINFEKEKNNPVIKSSDLKEGFDARAFRDPYIVKEDDAYYAIITNKNLDEDCGQLLIYKTRNFIDFEYKGILIKESLNVDPGIFECPSLARFSDIDVLIASLNFMPDKGILHKNFASTVYYRGHVDLENPGYTGDDLRLIDYGFDYYAPQNLLTPDYRNVLIAWRDMWEKEYYNKDSGWCGGLTLPREIKNYKTGMRIFPIHEITDSFKLCETFSKGFSIQDIKPSYLDIKGSNISFSLRKGDVEIKFHYDEKERLYVLERIGNDTKITTPLVKDNNIRYYPTRTSNHSIQLFIDNSAMEIYLDKGKACFTVNYYGDGKTILKVKGNIEKAKYSIFEK